MRNSRTEISQNPISPFEDVSQLFQLINIYPSLISPIDIGSTGDLKKITTLTALHDFDLPARYADMFVVPKDGACIHPEGRNLL